MLAFGNCDDGKTCTSNVCTGVQNGCLYPIIGGNCLIGGNCYTNNTTEPNNVCHICNSNAPTGWTNNSVDCEDGNVCSNDFCSGGLCSITSYQVDGYEPNNSRPGRAIPDASDCDGVGVRSLNATIYTPGDVDWFRYHHSDNTGCDFYPNVLLTNLPVDLDLEVYFTCADGDAPNDFSCLRGSRIAGAYGCRSTNSGTASEWVEISVNCTFAGAGDDHGYIDVYAYKWSGASDPTCQQPYTVQYGDD